VQLFFGISGFIIALPFARSRLAGDKPVNLRSYYLRRLTRIEPPYVIHLAFLFMLCALLLRWQPGEQHYYQNSNWLDYSGRHILASLFYSNGFIYGSHPYPNVVLWSLEVEVQFYLLAPILMQVYTIDRVWLRRGLLVGAIALLPLTGGWIGNWLGSPYLGWASLLGNFQFFLVGFLLADWQASAKTPAPRNWLWDFLFILAGFIVAFGRQSAWMGFVLPGIIGVCMVAAFKGTLAFRVLGNRWVTIIGGMCYTIYMYHLLLMSFLIRLPIFPHTHILWLDLLLYLVIMSLVIVPVCAVLFVVAERPFMRRDWPRKLVERFRGATRPEKLTTRS
jgi:peptidoglycan/LPS O-acetylase OafA/YrhL